MDLEFISSLFDPYEKLRPPNLPHDLFKDLVTLLQPNVHFP